MLVMDTDLEKLGDVAHRLPATPTQKPRREPVSDLHDSEPADRIALQRIEAALNKMDKGRYGFCDSCGDPIAVKKLDADPTRPFCGHCTL